METSLPKQLFQATLESTVTRLGLTEEEGADGGVLLPLFSQVPVAEGQVGEVRLFTGAPPRPKDFP